MTGVEVRARSVGSLLSERQTRGEALAGSQSAVFGPVVKAGEAA